MDINETCIVHVEDYFFLISFGISVINIYVFF